MADAFIGEIRAFGFNYIPYGWLACNGGTILIAQYQALASILGTRFGGNGQTTVGLPDLQGNTLIGAGTGAGLPPYVVGNTTGTPTVTLVYSQLGPHNHPVDAKGAQAGTPNMHGTPQANDFLTTYITNATPPAPAAAWLKAPNTDYEQMAPTMIGSAGGLAGATQPHENRQPYLPVLFGICVDGTYPVRS